MVTVTGWNQIEKEEPMARTTRFGRPNMAALSGEMGRKIFYHIMSTPPPDFEKMHEESMELMRQMEIEMKKHGMISDEVDDDE